MQQACGALKNLAANNADNQARIAAAGGIEAVVRVMGEHQANAAVMQQACWALAYLAGLDANHARIAAAGGIEAMVRGMGEHQANAAVMQDACWALGNIGWSDEALQKRIKDAGAEPLVRAAVAAPDATADTKWKGQRLLDRLGKSIPKALQTEKENFAAQRAAGDIVVERLRGCPLDVTHDVVAKTLQFDEFATAGAPEALTTSGVLYFEITMRGATVSALFHRLGFHWRTASSVGTCLWVLAAATSLHHGRWMVSDVANGLRVPRANGRARGCRAT